MAVRPDPPARLHAQRSTSARIAAALLLGVLAGAGLDCGNARADADAIRTLVNREVAAINGEDMHALSEIWAQDKNILMFDVPPPGRFQGWDQIGRLWKDFFDRVSEIHLTVENVQAEAQGTLGYATYDWAMTGQLGTYPLQDRGQATAIYRKKDGQWRLVHAHYSPVPPALAGQENRTRVTSPSGPTPEAGAAASPAPSASPKGAAKPAAGSQRKSP